MIAICVAKVMQTEGKTKRNEDFIYVLHSFNLMSPKI